MAECIEREALVNNLELLAHHEDRFRQSVILGVVGTIRATKAADAVVVTRCKDCRNHRELNRKDRLESGYAEGILWCMNRSDGVWADGFCSDGEPKEV